MNIPIDENGEYTPKKWYFKPLKQTIAESNFINEAMNLKKVFEDYYNKVKPKWVYEFNTPSSMMGDITWYYPGTKNETHAGDIYIVGNRYDLCVDGENDIWKKFPANNIAKMFAEIDKMIKR